MRFNEEIIRKGFILSGIMNIGGVLIFSRFFTNHAIPEADPVVMSNFGLLMIVVWGLLYLTMCEKYKELKWLVGVFAIEKFIYGIAWIRWMINNDLSSVYQQDLMAGIFYTIYGLNDWLFFLFFMVVFLRLWK